MTPTSESSGFLRKKEVNEEHNLGHYLLMFRFQLQTTFAHLFLCQKLCPAYFIRRTKKGYTYLPVKTGFSGKVFLGAVDLETDFWKKWVVVAIFAAESTKPLETFSLIMNIKSFLSNEKPWLIQAPNDGQFSPNCLSNFPPEDRKAAREWI
ncbi:hypothetical protein Y032_0002g1085 [Ancylostoma ceylanicum]|uniref:Uncharacterized protein n=1 Tax=Ancylostoma ceylanicum TaxID=53326 RepID=A0A016VYT0_9BILA|nr:hypothetical protein Y032_0002g1085 [Ancylostoma ceylanicum]